MTLRAVIIGVLGAVFIAVVGYVSRHIGGLTQLTRGHFPITVFGALFVVLAAVNPLLRKIRPNWPLKPAELAITLALTLVGCNLADVGLMRHFTSAVALPAVDYQIRPHWKRADLMSHVPPAMLLAGGDVSDPAVQELLLGRRGEEVRFRVGDIPWKPWLKLMALWGPIIVMFAAVSISLALVVHRNWCQRERLRYPIATFATMLMDQGHLAGKTSIFRDKLFWVGLLGLLTIRVVNGLHLWFPAECINIPLQFDFLEQISRAMPVFMKTPQSSYLARPVIFPTAVALAFLLAGDISFSLGISNLVSVTTMYFMLRAGVRTSGWESIGGVNEYLAFGSFVGFALMVAYIGRRHYWLTLKGALTFSRHDETERSAVWAGRVFLLSAVGLVVILSVVGLCPVVAFMLVATVILMHLIMARMSAECGVFFFMPGWSVLGVLLGLFGVESMGPGPIVIVGIFIAAMTAAPWECLMPYVTNGLKMTQDVSVKPGRVAAGSMVAFVVALVAVMIVGLWCIYYFGQSHSAVRVWWDEAARSVTKLKSLGELENTNSLTSVERVLTMQPRKDFVWAAGIGVALVLMCSALRLRFTWWPIHPVIFLVFGAWSIAKYSHSFMLGWLLKTMIYKLGGMKVYRRTLVFMAGVIAGDVLGGSIFMAVNLIYYHAYGVQGLEYVKSYIL